MPGSSFDIFETEDGYVAVTNDVRRAILSALAKKERQLPELVKLTKKAKPTLSSVHMRELLAAKLVEEVPHPTDRRKKIYRLKARRIGTSNLPVDQLRSAVRHYASGGARGLATALEAIAAAPASAPDATLRAQARRLGELSVAHLAATTAREAVTSLASLLEREGLARPLRLDLEGLTLELELEKQVDAEPERAALLVASMAEGLLSGRSEAGAEKVRWSMGAARRFTLALPAWE